MHEQQIWAYAEDLNRYTIHLCHHLQDAEDVAQNALVKAAQSKKGAFRGQASVRTWLHTIALNECRMLHRRASVATRKTAQSHFSRDPYSEPAFRNPEEAALLGEVQASLLSSMRALPRSHQQVLALRDGCGMSAKETSEILDITVGSVKSRLYRARRGLRDELDKQHPDHQLVA